MESDFSISAYLDRIEKANLSIIEERPIIDRTITLWWGFDGLRINEDGTIEWISRKPKKEERKEETFCYTPCCSITTTGNTLVQFLDSVSQTQTSPQDLMRYMLAQQMNSLQMQNTSLMVQQMQDIQMQNMCQLINHPQYMVGSAFNFNNMCNFIG